MNELRDDDKEKRVQKALKIMRKANIKLSHLDKEIAKLDLKKNKSDSQKEKKTGAKAASGDVVYDEKTPTLFKTIDQMQLAARANYALQQELTLNRGKITRGRPDDNLTKNKK